MILKIAVFVSATLFLLAFTIVGQRKKRIWAWARFLLFELNIILILINLKYWFADPLSPRQIISWLFLAVSLFLVLHGVRLLIAGGKPEGYFEQTTELVTRGVYRFIRHPMYGSLFYLTVGAVLKNMSPLVLALGLLSIASAVATARIEERDNLEKFGPDYGEYMKGTRMFVPFIF